MRSDERRTLMVLSIAGVAGAILFMPAIYFLGLWLAPPRPVPARTPAPTVIRQALWARAGGGPGHELRPLNPINFVVHRVCRFLAAQQSDAQIRGEKRAECLRQLPAIQGINYLADVHMRDEHVPVGSFRYGISEFATAAWVTRSWTAEELLDTLAERGEFGFGWRGVDAAARGYVGRATGDLTVPQAALVAAFIGDARTDPWCDRDAARAMRRRILERMRENNAITEAAFREADASDLGLGTPPPDRRQCKS